MKENLKTCTQDDVLLLKKTTVRFKELTSTFQPGVLKPNALADMIFSAPEDFVAVCQNYGEVTLSPEQPIQAAEVDEDPPQANKGAANDPLHEEAIKVSADPQQQPREVVMKQENPQEAMEGLAKVMQDPLHQLLEVSGVQVEEQVADPQEEEGTKKPLLEKPARDPPKENPVYGLDNYFDGEDYEGEEEDYEEEEEDHYLWDEDQLSQDEADLYDI